MDLSGILSATSRRLFVALGLATFLSVSAGASALNLEEAAPPPASQDQADPLKFTRGGRMIILWQIKPGKEQDFLLVWRTIKDHLSKMGDPGLAQFGQTLNLLKVEGPPGGASTYLFDLESVSTTYSYNPVTLLYETLKEDPEKPGVGLSYDQATEVYDKFKDVYDQIIPWPLTAAR
jgi:hypothetical protein